MRTIEVYDMAQILRRLDMVIDKETAISNYISTHQRSLDNGGQLRPQQIQACEFYRRFSYEMALSVTYTLQIWCRSYGREFRQGYLETSDDTLNQKYWAKVRSCLKMIHACREDGV